jgi:hypothetical protein
LQAHIHKLEKSAGKSRQRINDGFSQAIISIYGYALAQ